MIRRFYGGCVAAGKTGKVAVTACMRKLLTILNAMVRARPPVGSGVGRRHGLTINTVAPPSRETFAQPEGLAVWGL